MKKRWSSIFLFCLINICCAAQTAGYKFYSLLDSVKTSGFYNIEITPALSAHLKTDYSDLRIVNDSGKWVPHVLHNPSGEKEASLLPVNMEILKKINSNTQTELILKNKNLYFSKFNIIIKNTDAIRVAKLSGSDNLTDWFVIKDSTVLEPIASDEKDKTTYQIEFPSCYYKFYKIVINNKDNDPVNILSINYDAANIRFQSINTVSENPSCAIEQKDSAKVSYIKITQKQAYHFELFNLKISGAKYFYRKVDMYISHGKNNSISNPGELYESFYISNKSSLEFIVPITNTEEFYLLIYNEDNMPLKIGEVKTWSYKHFLTTYLEHKNNYRLIMSNIFAAMPNYDLNKISLKISDSISSLSFGKIIAFEEKTTTAASEKNNKWILWTAITAALLILLLFTKKMITEVNKRKQDDSV